MVFATLSTPKHASSNMNLRYLVVVSLVLLVSGISYSVEAQKKSNTGLTVVKEGIGLHGLRVGYSTRSDVIRKLGRRFKTRKNGRYSFQMMYPNGLSFYYCQKDNVQQIFVIEIRAPFRARTSKGIVLSKSTLSDIRRVYGKSKKGLRYSGVEFYYDTYKGKKVVTVIDIVEKRGLRQCG